jgi:hypothetical protein
VMVSRSTFSWDHERGIKNKIKRNAAHGLAHRSMRELLLRKSIGDYTARTRRRDECDCKVISIAEC